MDGARIGFSAEGAIRRSDFGIATAAVLIAAAVIPVKASWNVELLSSGAPKIPTAGADAALGPATGSVGDRASIAVTGDAFGGANNPAQGVFVGDRVDVGADWFSPVRSAERSDAAIPPLNGKVESVEEIKVATLERSGQVSVLKEE